MHKPTSVSQHCISADKSSYMAIKKNLIGINPNTASEACQSSNALHKTGATINSS